jgi:hypothetical protein
MYRAGGVAQVVEPLHREHKAHEYKLQYCQKNKFNVHNVLTKPMRYKLPGKNRNDDDNEKHVTDAKNCSL